MKTPKAVSKYLSEIGRRGGMVGGKATGKCKVRGKSSYYRRIRKMVGKAKSKCQ
jgi:hypothetical protein